MSEISRTHSRPLVIAHRGASRLAPDNTLEAFRRAVELGADMVELDVRRTADGAVAVHHDARLPDGRAVAGVAASDLPAHVPLLDAALEACSGVAVNVELKSDPGEPGFDPARLLVDDVVEVVRRRGDVDRVVLSSFDLELLERSRAVAPELRAAWLVVAPPDEVVDSVLQSGLQGLHPWYAHATGELIDRCHADGLFVSCWTCDDPLRMVELARLGIDGICTAVPDLALLALMPWAEQWAASASGQGSHERQ